jgi:hypothetical protein
MKYWLVAVFALLSMRTFAQEEAIESDPDCLKFKEGTFTFEEYPHNTLIVTRTKSKQVEHETFEDLKLKFKVKWIDECTYILTYLGANKVYPGSKKGDTMTIKIVKTEGNKYWYEAEHKGEMIPGEMIKIE